MRCAKIGSVHLLALDTCDSRGSIALISDGKICGEVLHPAAEDFSSWLLPAVDGLLAENSLNHRDLMGYAVASGPGSFTGVRVGLTTAKAWAEIYSKPIFAVSRLTVFTDFAPPRADFVATFIDAQRKQIFAALYRREPNAWALVGDEAVIEPSHFFDSAIEASRGRALAWITLDPVILTSHPMWNNEIPAGSTVINVEPPLASAIGLHALRYLSARGIDALTLDANYVRRSDAEILGKKAVTP